MEVEVELRASSHEVYNFSADKAGQSDLARCEAEKVGKQRLASSLSKFFILIQLNIFPPPNFFPLTILLAQLFESCPVNLA